ncbi:hypothetical protein CTA1_10686 [Colletotrichum tanaceti]|uniref:Uncharacterized protein n=1 Tax=Colletotrichum tanaceti TaxID=1306861 RepID=A0A4V6DGF7_9PEZI|nr:hypothetical protein CTA1_10686 [Colletotrichum tanaceti]
MSPSSGSWHLEYTSSDSETSSMEADYLEHQNRTTFPPLLPSAQGPVHERKQMTDSITNKVSRLENSRVSVPSLVASDASSAASVASMEDNGVQGLWVQMKERRQRLNSLKQDMATKRKALQELRRRKDEADNTFMKMLRPILVRDRRGLTGASDELLDERFAEMQSLLGDLSNAKEEYEDLLLYHNQYAYNMDVKKFAGLTPSAEEIEFMDEFPEEEREKRESVDRLTEEVGRLKEVCERKGAMKKHPSFKIAYALDPNIGEDLSLDSPPPQSGSLAHWQFPELLSHPDHVLREEPLTAVDELKRAAKLPAESPVRKAQLYAAKKEYGISRLVSEFKEEDKSDFITRWLLHQLRTSPLAVKLLYSTFVQTIRLRIVNLQRWQQDVLFHWWKDGAVKPPDYFLGPLTGSGRVWHGHEAFPERNTQISSRKVATEDWSSGSRQVCEDVSRPTAIC